MAFPNTNYPASLDSSEDRTNFVDWVDEDDFDYHDKQIMAIQTFLGVSGALLGDGVASSGWAGVVSPVADAGTAFQVAARNDFTSGKLLSVGDNYDVAYSEKVYIDFDGIVYGSGYLVPELANSPTTPSATEGLFWANDDNPNRAMYTDGDDDDHILAYLSELGGAWLEDGGTPNVIYPETYASDVVAIGRLDVEGDEHLSVEGPVHIQKSDATDTIPALTVKGSGSHPAAQPIATYDEDRTTSTAPVILVDTESTTAPVIEFQTVDGTRGDIAFNVSARTADPSDPSVGDFWYSFNNVLKYEDDVGEKTIATLDDISGASPWSESGSPNTLYPTTHASDVVAIGTDTPVGAAHLTVTGGVDIQKSDATDTIPALTITTASSHPTAQPTVKFVESRTDSTAPVIVVDTESATAAGIEIQMVDGTRGDIYFNTGRTADPTNPSAGDFWYSHTHVLKYEDDVGEKTIATTADVPTLLWQDTSNVINLVNSSDTVSIGHTVMNGNEKARVYGGGLHIDKNDAGAVPGIKVVTDDTNHPDNQPVVVIEQGNTGATAASILVNQGTAVNAPAITLEIPDGADYGDIVFSSNRSGNPTSVTEGHFWYDPVNHVFKFHNGTGQLALATGGETYWSESGIILSPATADNTIKVTRTTAPPAPEEGEQWFDTTTHKPMVYDGAGSIEIGGVGGASQILVVAQTASTHTADGTFQKPYATVAAAITAATAKNPTSSNVVALVFMPGEYEETLTLADSYVNYVAFEPGSTIFTRSSADTLTIPAGVSNAAFYGLTFRNSGAFNPLVSASNGGVLYFDNCQFEGTADNEESYIEATGSSDLKVRNSRFVHSFKNNYILKHSGSGSISIENSQFDGRVVLSNGDSEFKVCTFEQSATSGACILRETTASKSQVLMGCTINTTGATSNCLEFDIATNLTLLSNRFLNSGSSEDVAASVSVTGVDASSNLMVNGMNGNISLSSEVHRVGGGIDCHTSIDAAIDAAGADYTILLAPGTYDEAITSISDASLVIRGTNPNNTIITNASGTALGLGIGASDVKLHDVQIKTTTINYIVEVQSNGGTVLFHNCYFVSTFSGNDAVNITGSSDVVFEQCEFEATSAVRDVLTADGTGGCYLRDCRVILGTVNIIGQDFYAYDTIFADGDTGDNKGVITNNTTTGKDLHLDNCKIGAADNCYGIYLNVSANLSVLNCTFTTTDTPAEDIKAASVVTGCKLEGNVWANGISTEIVPDGNRYIQIRCLDQDTDQANDTNVAGDFRVREAMVIRGAGAYFDTAGTGSTTTIDIHNDGTTIFDTQITVDASEKTSETALAPPVLDTGGDYRVAADDIITVDIDSIASGTAAKGLVVWLYVWHP